MKFTILFLTLICSTISALTEKNNTEIIDFSRCILGNSQIIKDIARIKETKKDELLLVLFEVFPRDVQIVMGCYDKHIKGKKIDLPAALIAVWEHLPKNVKDSLISAAKKLGKKALYTICMRILRDKKQEICKVFKPF